MSRFQIALASLAVLASVASLCALVSCTGYKPDTSFIWGPGGGTSGNVLATLYAEGGGAGGYDSGAADIEVLVFDADTGDPISGAYVVIGQGMDAFWQYTDGNGMVRFPQSQIDPKIDQSKVTAASPGYENCSFVNFMRAQYAIPLRPTHDADYVNITGTMYGLTAGIMGWRGMVHSNSLRYANDGNLDTVTLTETEDEYDVYLKPGHVRLCFLEADDLPGYAEPTNCYYEDIGTYNRGETDVQDRNFGSMSFNWFQMTNGSVGGNTSSVWGDPVPGDPVCRMDLFYDDSVTPMTAGFGVLDTFSPYTYSVKFLDLEGPWTYRLAVGFDNQANSPFGRTEVFEHFEGSMSSQAPAIAEIPSPVGQNTPSEATTVPPNPYLNGFVGGTIQSHFPIYVFRVERDSVSWPGRMFWTIVVWSGGNPPEVQIDFPIPESSLSWQSGHTYRWYIESYAPTAELFPERIFMWKTMLKRMKVYSRSTKRTFTIQ